MEEILKSGREEAPSPPAVSSEQVRGQAEEADGLRKAGEAVAIVSAGVLAGGGAGMLGGVVLGAINPSCLGMVGIAVGAVASVPLGRAILKRLEGGTGPPAGLVPTQIPARRPRRRSGSRRGLGGRRGARPVVAAEAAR